MTTDGPARRAPAVPRALVDRLRVCRTDLPGATGVPAQVGEAVSPEDVVAHVVREGEAAAWKTPGALVPGGQGAPRTARFSR